MIVTPEYFFGMLTKIMIVAHFQCVYSFYLNYFL